MRTESRLLLGLAALAAGAGLLAAALVHPDRGAAVPRGAGDVHRPARHLGAGEHDIQNINILNHYIGMKPIDPAEVDVLTIMPWVVGFLMVARWWWR
jgi:hypothetical protein